MTDAREAARGVARSTDGEPLLDRDHLDRQTFGDAALAGELLALFREQCRRLLLGIGDGGRGADARADLAHTLKGSALGVGAARVAAAASEAEALLRAPAGDGLVAAAVERLDGAVRATLAEIEAPGLAAS